MAVIVDGYNVLHASRWLSSRFKGVDRQGLCQLLGTLARHRAEKITVVFDAAPARGDPGISKSLPIELVYSGHRRTADEVIIQMVNDSSGPRDLTVVSSDRQIRAVAKRRGCKLSRAGEFIKSATEELAQSETQLSAEPTEKQEGLGREQTRQWLSEFGLDPDEEEDPHEKMYRE